METMTAVVDTTTGCFCEDGHEPDDRFIVVTVPRNPDAQGERYSGDPTHPIRSATPTEIAALQVATVQDDAAAQITPVIEAVVAGLLTSVLGKPPSQQQHDDAIANVKASLQAQATGQPATAIASAASAAVPTGS